MERKYAILIVDDNVDLASSLRDVLETESYDATIAHNGQDALAICRQSNVELALVDAKLPDTSGTELIEELAKLSSALEYIIITGHASLDSAIDAAKRESVVSYELKPLNIDHLLAIIRQICERKQMEKALKESEEKYRAIFAQARDGIVLIDSENFYIIDCNPEFESQTGRKLKQLKEMKIWEVRPPEKVKAAREKFAEIREKGAGGSAELEFQKPDGEIVSIEFLAKRIKIQGKDYIQAIARDITERKKIQEQLMVNDRLASIGELVSGVAHELNNPLTGVIGFSDLLMGRKDLPDDVKKEIKIINREARRTATIVKNLLTFARKHPKEKQLTQINSAIQTVLELRAYEQKVNNIQVNAQFAPDLPAIMANTFDLQQVFLNILVNAEYAMLEAHGKGTITITTERDGDIIRASLSDDGPGIFEETLGHLFDPFFTTKEVGKGTGLGLSMCYGIITEHGGRIYAESEPGKGATFIIELPISK